MEKLKSGKNENPKHWKQFVEHRGKVVAETHDGTRIVYSDGRAVITRPDGSKEIREMGRGDIDSFLDASSRNQNESGAEDSEKILSTLREKFNKIALKSIHQMAILEDFFRDEIRRRNIRIDAEILNQIMYIIRNHGRATGVAGIEDVYEVVPASKYRNETLVKTPVEISKETVDLKFKDSEILDQSSLEDFKEKVDLEGLLSAMEAAVTRVDEQEKIQ